MSMGIIFELGKLMYPWPLNCFICGEDTLGEHVLCPSCRRSIRQDTGMCEFAGSPLTRSVAAHHYTEEVRTMVALLKYNSLSALAREMADDMIRAADAAEMKLPDVITYVPMHSRRRRQKYFDQAEVLARHVAAAWKMRDTKALKRVRYSRQQARTRGYEARMRNVKDAFAVCGDVKGRHVLLIDDVYTTGATSGECARVLIEAGASRVDVMVYAVAQDVKAAIRSEYTQQNSINMQ